MSRDLPDHVQTAIDKALKGEAREQRGRVEPMFEVKSSSLLPVGVEWALVSPRRQGESLEDWAKRCAFAKSDKPPLALGRIAAVNYRSELERDYAALLEAQRLAGEILAWAHEGITLNLGGGAKYKPDFNIVGKDCELTMAECKGFRREAAIVRIKVAAAKFPWLRFVLVTRDEGGWNHTEVKA